MRRHYQRHRRRQAGSTGSYGPMVEVRRDQGEPGGSPGKLGMLTRGAVGAAEGEETKRRGGYRG
jgi:hypothetical protein